MMGRYKRILMAMSILVILVLAWLVCLGNAWTIQGYEKQVELRYKEKDLTIDTLVHMEKGEAENEEKLVQTYTAWNEVVGTTFENKGLNKKVSGSRLEVYGDMSLLIGRKKIWGELLHKGSTEEIVISQGLAQALWGGTDVIGKEITIDAADYTVKGIIEEKKPIAFTHTKQEKDRAFESLRIEMVDISNVEEDINTLRFKYNLPEGNLKNLSLSSLFFSQLALLPGWLLGIYGLLRLYSFIYKTHHYWISALLLGVIALVATGGMMYILQINLTIPSYMIPNQWSDFEWWERTWDNLITTREAVNSLPTYLPDRWYEIIKSKIIVSGILTGFGMVAMVKRIKISNGRELFWMTLLTLVITFGSILLLYGMGVELLITRALWLGIPYYFVIQLFIDKWQRLLNN